MLSPACLLALGGPWDNKHHLLSSCARIRTAHRIISTSYHSCHPARTHCALSPACLLALGGPWGLAWPHTLPPLLSVATAHMDTLAGHGTNSLVK